MRLVSVGVRVRLVSMWFTLSLICPSSHGVRSAANWFFSQSTFCWKGNWATEESS